MPLPASPPPPAAAAAPAGLAGHSEVKEGTAEALVNFLGYVNTTQMLEALP